MPRRRMTDVGSVTLTRTASEIEKLLRDPVTLKQLIPKASHVALTPPGRYEVTLIFPLGPLRGQYRIDAVLQETAPLHFKLWGNCQGRFGRGAAEATIVLRPDDRHETRIEWRYDGTIYGPIALVTSIIAKPAASLFIERFFTVLANISDLAISII